MTTQLLTLQSGLLVALLLFLHSLHLSAQSSVGSIQLNPVLSTLAAGWLIRAATRELE